MEGKNISKYLFIIILLVLLYLAFKLAQPFLTYILLGLILTVACYPLQKWINKLVKNKKISSIIVILFILIIIVIPAFLVTSALVKQTLGLVSSLNMESFNKVNDYLVSQLGPKADLKNNISSIITGLQNFVLKSAVSIAGSVAQIALGIFIMFFIMYYGLAEGDQWGAQLKSLLPLSKTRKEHLAAHIKNVTKAVIYGQVLVAILQGALGGIGFWIAGIASPVFWGAIMTVLAFLPIPVIGTGLVWIPAGIMLIYQGNIGGGIFILAYGAIIVSGIDNILRPRIISGKAKIHPIVALIGMLGGLKLFGFIGIIIGPLVAALFIAMVGFFYEDYVHKKEVLDREKSKS